MADSKYTAQAGNATFPDETTFDTGPLGDDRWRPAPTMSPPGVWEAIRTSPLVVLAAILICAGLGVAAGLVRHPKYSATARVAVLHLNFAAAGSISSYSTAAAILADTYARSVDADGVVNPLALQFHTTPSVIRADLSGAGIPASPVFDLTATTTAARSAIGLVNSAGPALEKYIQGVNGTSPDAGRIYSNLVRAEGNLALAQVTKDGLQAGIQSANAVKKGQQQQLTAAQRRTLATAMTTVATAQDRVSSLRQAYQQSIVGTSQTQFMQPLESALSASSDRSSKMTLFAFAGAALGLALGVALALLRRTRWGVRPGLR